MRTHSAMQRPPMTYLGLVAAELSVAVRETLETNREFHVARAHDVLDLELGELGVEAKLLHDTRVLARRQARVVLGLGASDDHLARGEDKRCRLGITNTHDHSRKTLEGSNDG